MNGPARGCVRRTRTGQRHKESIPLSADADDGWPADIGLDFVGQASRRFAELQRGEAIAVNGHIHIGDSGAKVCRTIRQAFR